MPSSVDIFPVKSYQIVDVWPKAASLFDKIKDMLEPEYSMEEVKNLLKEKKFQLWIAESQKTYIGLAMTTIIIFPNSKICRIIGCAGNDMMLWVNLISYIEDWAIDNKCDYIDLFGRKGWERVLKIKGYDDVKVVLRKELKGVK